MSNMTAQAIRAKTYADTFAAQPVPTSTRRSADNRDYVAKRAVEDASREIVRAVATGVGLPEPTNADLDFTDAASVFSNAGGVILHRQGGLQITPAALESRKFVTVVFRGEHVAVTVDEAFDRGLQENADWDRPCEDDEAIRAISGNAVNAARKMLDDIRIA